jgi:hypothetical protein
MLLSRISGRSARRWLPTAVAFALFAAQGASFAHLALVKHEYCPEHGEFEHVEASPPARTAAPDPGIPGVAPRPAASGSHEHEACTVWAHRREATLTARPDVVVALVVQAAKVAPLVTRAPLSEPRFRLAPKQSPPA